MTSKVFRLEYGYSFEYIFFYVFGAYRSSYFQVVSEDINLLMRIFANVRDVNVTIAIND